MTLICYQSLNSNSSKDHGLKATTTQKYTSDTHNNFFNSQTSSLYLEYPKQEKMSIEPTEGPANLIGMAPYDSMSKGSHDGIEMLSLVTGKALQFHEMASRIPNTFGIANGARPDVMVFGEVDSSHSDWYSLQYYAGKRIDQNRTYDKTCQAFSVHSENTGTKVIGWGIGWIAIEVVNLVAVFVHVPNKIAKDKYLTTEFYKQIFQEIKYFDVMLGDTNQPSTEDYTVDCINNATWGNDYKYISNDKILFTLDTYKKPYSGTNSNSKEMYDIAIYNDFTLKNKYIRLEYVSQLTTDTKSGSSKAVAMTDHMGMIVYIA